MLIYYNYRIYLKNVSYYYCDYMYIFRGKNIIVTGIYASRTYKYVNINDPDLLPRYNTKTGQVHTARVVIRLIQQIADFHCQVFTSAAFKFGCGVC